MRDPAYTPLARTGGAGGAVRAASTSETGPADITADTRAFTAAIRTRIFDVLKAWWRQDAQAMSGVLEIPARAEADSAAEPWTPDRVRATLEAYRVEHEALRFDPEARNARHTHVTAPPGQPTWRVQQVLVDPEMLNDWVAEIVVDVEASRARQQPVLWLARIGPLA
jgi:hypothetical protein